MAVGRFLALALVLAALAACGDGGAPSAPLAPRTRPPGAGDLPPEDVFLREIDRSRGHRDVFPVIRDPAFVPAADAPRMTADELVIGLDRGDVQFAYPVNLLNYHEIVEHTVDGLDLLVCW